ncbi:MAG: DUF4279 domain-containing protein [Elusimicrobia bacterium]|nr:DUF4279 domain-containing protein [Elusimicrobiota bacterium]
MILNEGYVYFSLFGDDFDPDQVSEIIGIKATKTRRKGTPVPKHTSWIFSTDELKSERIDVYEMSSALISKLAPFTEGIVEARKRFGLAAVLEVVLRISPDESLSTPAIGFERDVLEFVYKTGATIDIDTYRA